MEALEQLRDAKAVEGSIFRRQLSLCYRIVMNILGIYKIEVQRMNDNGLGFLKGKKIAMGCTSVLDGNY